MVLFVDRRPRARRRRAFDAALPARAVRYLGKVCEFEGTPLYPTDPIAAYEADALIDLADDMRSPVASTFGIADQAEKEAARAALWAEGGASAASAIVVPEKRRVPLAGKQAKWAAALDATLAKDPMTTLTIGNLYAFCMVNMFRTPTFLDGVPPGVFDQYANIAKHHDWIANLAPVKAYYADKEEREAFKPLAAEPAAKKAKTDA